MARCHVAFEEAPSPVARDDRTKVELGPPPAPAWRGRAGLVERRRLRPSTVATALAVALVAWAVWPSPATPAEPEADEAAEVRTPLPGGGAVEVRVGDVVAPPWRGVLEHHPDARPAVSVPNVHVLALDGADGASALFVVDATRRAFGDPERAWRDDADPERVLGDPAGTGLRTIQWDAGGYGISLTTTGLDLGGQRRLAGAIVLPEGPALVHGRAPDLDAAALAALGLRLADLRSGPGTPVGSPLVGQSGGASIDGLVHRADGAPVLVSVVQDQVASASRVRRALAPHADVDVAAIPGATTAALVRHPGTAAVDRRVRGWNRLLVDHPSGVTVELSTDVLGGDELLALAAGLDLDRLARTVAPRR
ncbi:MAG: hypothetical protein ACLGIC_05375 [Acidimicrobiia bacterium]